MSSIVGLAILGLTTNGIKVKSEGEVYKEIKSDYIKMRIFDNGYNGSAATNKVSGEEYRIIYGYDKSPGTSFTTIRIDGENNDKILQQDVTISQTPTNSSNNKVNTTVYKVDNIEVTQRLEIVNNPGTGREDSVKYSYIIKNNDNKSHKVGIRLLLDTMLGAEDGAPFRVPGVGAVTSEREFVGDQIPEYYQVFESLDNANKMAQGTLKGSGATSPDKFAIADWVYAVDTYWDYTINTNRSIQYDSSALIWWNPVTIQAGQTKEFSTYYGIGTVSGNSEVSVTGPARLEVNSETGTWETFTVTAYINNNTGSTMRNVPVEIVLPEGLVLAEGQRQQQTIESIENEAVGQVSWQVQATQAGTFEYSVQSGNLSAKRSIEVPELPKGYVSQPQSKIETSSNPGESGYNTEDVKATITAVNNIKYDEGVDPESIANKPGIKEIHYVINGQEKLVSGDKAEFVINTDGTNKIKYWSVSEDGVKETEKEIEVKVDKEGPEIKINNEAREYTVNEDFVVDVEVTDKASGVKAFTITYDGKEVKNKDVIDLINTIGKHELKVVAEDNVGHKSEKLFEVNVVAGVTRVVLNKHQMLLEVGAEGQLIATVYPEDVKNKEVTWESSDPTVATVENGKIKALKVGETTITVKTKEGGYTDTCKVVVEDNSKALPVTGSNLNYLIPFGVIMMLGATFIIKKRKPEVD